MSGDLGLAKGPYWIDLPGNIEVQVRPLDTSLYYQAKAWTTAKFATIIEDRANVEMVGGTVEGLPDLETEHGRAGFWEYLYVCGLAVAGIMDWKRVVGEDKAILDVTEAEICKQMRRIGVAEEFVGKYTSERNLVLAEGNA